MVIYLHKHYESCSLPVIDLIDILEKQNTLITINYGTYFCVLGFCIQSL